MKLEWFLIRYVSRRTVNSSLLIRLIAMLSRFLRHYLDVCSFLSSPFVKYKLPFCLRDRQFRPNLLNIFINFVASMFNSLCCLYDCRRKVAAVKWFRNYISEVWCSIAASGINRSGQCQCFLLKLICDGSIYRWCIGDGVVYSSGFCNCIETIAFSDSRARLVAGSFQGYKGHADGKPSDARFNHPKGVALDDNGNVYVADTSNLAIRKIVDSGTYN